MDQSKLTLLQNSGFIQPSSVVPRRLVASISGKAKEGKTHFSLTFPPPVFLIDIDMGTEGVVEKFKAAGKDIYIYSVRIPKTENQHQYQEIWDDIQKKMEMIWGINEGSCIIDTSTEGYELSRLAKFGKLANVQPYNYTQVNVEWKELMKKAYDATNMNTIFIHRLKREYINNSPTGKMEVAGYGDIEYQTQINLVAFRDQSIPGDGGFKVFIKDCRRNPAVNGFLIDPVAGYPVNADTLLYLVHGQ